MPTVWVNVLPCISVKYVCNIIPSFRYHFFLSKKKVSGIIKLVIVIKKEVLLVYN